MSERPTPETDALILSKAGFGATDWEWRQHSRRLERERDEAREELKAELARIQLLLLDPHAVFLNLLHGKIAKLDWDKLEHIHGPHPARVERDEAQEEINRYREKLDLLPISWEV